VISSDVATSWVIAHFKSNLKKNGCKEYLKLSKNCKGGTSSFQKNAERYLKPWFCCLPIVYEDKITT
jgi:hypothetical protein